LVASTDGDPPPRGAIQGFAGLRSPVGFPPHPTPSDPEEFPKKNTRKPIGKATEKRG